MSNLKLLSTLTLLLTGSMVYAQLVSNETELNNAINSAAPGTTITLADGTWKDVFIDIDKNGSENAPITITAQNPGAVLMTGNSRVYMEGAYITVSGLVFQDPSNLVNSSSEIEPVIELKRCNNCKVLNNKIDGYNGTETQKAFKFKWILADGLNNEIAYNSFLGKYGVGSIINDNRNSSGPDYLKIHHNYFAGRRPINELNEDNDQDAIRIGNSSTSLASSFSEVYDNYFYDFFGEVEVISNKSGDNKYYNNTFRDYAGTLTLRHGDNCEVFNNYFFAEENAFSGGVRVIGEGHKVYNNYIEAVNFRKPSGAGSNATGGINVTNGRPNSALNGYYQVKNVQIINNTFVNCDYALRIGTMVSSDLSLEPVNLTVANNIMYNTSEDEYQILTEPSGSSKSEGNITNLANSAMADDGNFYRLVDGSSAIDKSIGNYSFITEDILGGNRDGITDAGAEEFGANGMKLPYTAADVGVNVGFGVAENPTLTVSPNTLTFGKNGGSMTFEVIANVDWTITENISWLSLDITSGSGRGFVTATVDENEIGAERTETISINEVAGGTDLSSELSIIQLETFIPSEIPVTGTTTLGMQDKDDISEENAYDDNLSSYWTGDPDTEAEVSITFDLTCLHELTEIGINFWKADERTTTFSVEVGKTESGPFTTVIDNETSAESGVTVDTEQIFSLNGIVGRYVKFVGIGNSTSTNWTSIANVNIYGDISCIDPLNVFDNKDESEIRLFPVPASDGVINVLSNSKAIGKIEIYNASGQKVLMTNGKGIFSKQIDVTNLDTGIYFMKLEGIGEAKFIIK